jgi:hypothetical protein
VISGYRLKLDTVKRSDNMPVQCLYQDLIKEKYRSKGINNKFLLLSIILFGLITSCVSIGTSKLSENVMNNVIEGESSKDQVLRLLGPPEQSLISDNTSLDIYINRVVPTKVIGDFILESRYEVWMYSKWSYFAVDPFLIPSKESSKIGLVIFNRNDVCIKRLYNEENMVKF